MAVGCGFTACKYMIVRTISLNKDLSCVVDLHMYVVIVIDTLLIIFLIYSYFPVVVSK